MRLTKQKPFVNSENKKGGSLFWEKMYGKTLLFFLQQLSFYGEMFNMPQN